MAGGALKAVPGQERRHRTLRSAIEHAAIEVVTACSVGLVALIAAAVARCILWIAR